MTIASYNFTVNASVKKIYTTLADSDKVQSISITSYPQRIDYSVVGSW